MFKRFVRRSWGWYWVLLDRKHFKVKLFRVRAKHALSLQYHNHRSELWLFLRGAGIFIWGKNKHKSDVSAGDFCEAGVRELHRYEASTVTWVLEAQYGERCTEEDIVRV